MDTVPLICFLLALMLIPVIRYSGRRARESRTLTQPDYETGWQIEQLKRRVAKLEDAEARNRQN